MAGSPQGLAAIRHCPSTRRQPPSTHVGRGLHTTRYIQGDGRTGVKEKHRQRDRWSTTGELATLVPPLSGSTLTHFIPREQLTWYVRVEVNPCFVMFSFLSRPDRSRSPDHGRFFFLFCYFTRLLRFLLMLPIS